MARHSKVLVSILLCTVLVLCSMRSADTASVVTALIIIDVQDCFLPGGNMAVTDGGAVIDVINRIRKTWHQSFQVTVLTKDWHCPKHVSFASSHDGHKPLDIVQLTYTLQGGLCTTSGVTVPGTVRCAGETKVVSQRLWADHCIADVTSGGTSSDISRNLVVNSSDIIVTKGDNCQRDSYSAFYDNGHFNMTRLHGELMSRGVNRVFLAGLALDYCVLESAKDAQILGYDTSVILDATRPIANDTGTKAVETLKSTGVHVVTSEQLKEILGPGNSSTDVLTLKMALVSMSVILCWNQLD